MILQGVALQNFRLHKNYLLKFKENTTVIVGNNAVGKTSIVEAINLLSTGNSFRAGKVEEMIDFDNELARVKGVVIDRINENDNDERDEIEVLLTRGVVGGKRTQSRLFSVNGVRRRKKDAIGKFYTVVFRPEDMRMVEGSPARRRSFLDNVLSLLHLDYEVALKNYDQTLKRRNKLLLLIKEGKQPSTVLQYWNLNLIKYGEVLQNYRQQFLESFINVEFPLDFSIEYDPSIISAQRLEQYTQKEMIVGHTLIGPHKDDFIIHLVAKNKQENGDEGKINKKNDHESQQKSQKFRLDVFGSRGQQRLGVLWLKFCELEFLKNNSQTKTVLLLDDILSELDDDSKKLALSVLNNYQSVVTTTEEKVLKDVSSVVKKIDVIYL